MEQVKIYKSAHGILELVEELRNSGYKQGVDFDFEFVPARWEGILSLSATENSHGIFTFYREELATYATLKWG